MNLLDLQKTLGHLAMPAGLLWLALLALTLFLLRRRQWLAAALSLLVWAGFGAAGNLHLGAALAASLERRVPLPDLGRPFDAVFVLGGGSEIDPSGAPQLSPAGDRLLTAARLWHAGRARRLVLSGVAGDGLAGLRDGAEESRVLLSAVGVPADVMEAVPERCWITREEIAAYARLQRARGWQRCALVSSAAHLPRAMALAERAGLRVVPVPCDFHGRARPFRLSHLVPRHEGFSLVQKACWEYLGAAVGR